MLADPDKKKIEITLTMCKTNSYVLQIKMLKSINRGELDLGYAETAHYTNFNITLV